MEEEKKFTIYLHRCPNGKCYVGMTSQNVNVRWGTKGQKYKRNKDFYPDIEKYGWDNIEHIILEEGLSKEDACESEKHNIKKYNCIYPNGYNLSIGGDVPWCLGKHLPKETREKISKSHIGKKMSKEFCEKRRQYVLNNLDKYEFIGKSLYGSDNPNYGNHKLLGTKMTNEQKQKLSNSLKNSEKFKKYHEIRRGNNPTLGKKWTQKEKEKISKKIIYMNKIYPSVIEFCNEFNLNRNIVSGWLNKRNPMPRKYIDNGLKFYENTDIQYEANRIKKVICGEYEFYSILECAEYYKEDYSKMAKWLSGRDNMPKKFIELNLHFDGENREYTEQIFNEKMVVMDNIIFESISQLGRYTKGASSKFSVYLSNKKPMPQKWLDRGLRYYNPDTDKDLPIYVDTKNEV